MSAQRSVQMNPLTVNAWQDEYWRRSWFQEITNAFALYIYSSFRGQPIVISWLLSLSLCHRVIARRVIGDNLEVGGVNFIGGEMNNYFHCIHKPKSLCPQIPRPGFSTPDCGHYSVANITGVSRLVNESIRNCFWFGFWFKFCLQSISNFVLLWYDSSPVSQIHCAHNIFIRECDQACAVVLIPWLQYVCDYVNAISHLHDALNTIIKKHQSVG